MKRLLMFVGVAVVAAAMYVAASPASQQGGFASQKEVSALKKQVASLSKSLKSTKKEADAVAGFLVGLLPEHERRRLGREPVRRRPGGHVRLLVHRQRQRLRRP